MVVVVGICLTGVLVVVVVVAVFVVARRSPALVASSTCTTPRVPVSHDTVSPPPRIAVASVAVRTQCNSVAAGVEVVAVVGISRLAVLGSCSMGYGPRALALIA